MTITIQGRKTFRSQFGSAIRACRASKHLTQAELATRLRTTQPAVARIEGGRIDPGLSTCDHMFSALDVVAELRLTDRSTGELITSIRSDSSDQS